MFKKLRKRFIEFLKGFLTEEELIELSITIFSYGEDTPDKEMEAEMFEDLSGVENFMEYLRQTMFNDVNRYFSASSEANRNQVKGAYSRSMYLRSRVMKANEKKKEGDSKPRSLAMSRYMS